MSAAVCSNSDSCCRVLHTHPAGNLIFIFSIFPESFDHWLPRLTNGRSDRVTCVAPCPLPTPPPAQPELQARVVQIFSWCWEEGGGEGGGGSSRPRHTPRELAGRTVPGCGLALPAVLGWGRHREFCGAGGDRLGQTSDLSTVNTRVAPDFWVCEHTASQSSVSQCHQVIPGAAGAVCDML